MNNGRYKPIIKEYERAEETKDKLDSLFTFVVMMATNHIKEIDTKVNKIIRYGIFIALAMLLAILFQDQLSLGKLATLLIKLL